jgi:hypothetical protein
MKSVTRTALSLSFLALASACGAVDVDYQITPLSQTIQLQVGQELRSATIETLSTTIETATLRDGAEEFENIFEQQEAATVDDNDPLLLFTRANVKPGTIDNLVVAFGDASIGTAQEADNEELAGFAFALRGTVDIDPNVPGEETVLLVRIKAPEFPTTLEFTRTEIPDRSAQVFLNTVFDLEAFLALSDYAPLVDNGAVVIDDRTNPEAALEIQSNLSAALSETEIAVSNF